MNETIQFADPAAQRELFYLIATAFGLVGVVAVGASMRWIKGREAWSGTPPNPVLAVFFAVLCWGVLPFTFYRLTAPLAFHTLEIADGEARFLRVMPDAIRVVPVADIVQVEVLGNGRIAFWFVEPGGTFSDDDLEVTPVIYSGDQPAKLATARDALKAAGWAP